MGRGTIMPKVIENLESKLIKTAEILFIEEGYDAVNIRSIAKSSNVAVGTVYNYFSSKEELYQAVLKDSWDNTMDALQRILMAELSLDEKIMSFVNTMYVEVENRKGLGGRMILEERKSGKSKESHTEKKLVQYMDKVRDMFVELIKHHEILCRKFEDPTRLADVVIGSFWVLHRSYADEGQKNLAFIEQYLNCFLTE